MANCDLVEEQETCLFVHGITVSWLIRRSLFLDSGPRLRNSSVSLELDLIMSAAELTHLPSTLRIIETDSAPRRPPMENTDTVTDQRRVDVSTARGCPYLSVHVVL